MQSLTKLPRQNMLRYINPCLATNVVEEIRIIRLVDVISLPICPICEKYIIGTDCGALDPPEECPFESKEMT